MGADDIPAFRRISSPAVDLRVSIESNLPASLPVGSATAIFCFGHCFDRHQSVDGLELLVNGPLGAETKVEIVDPKATDAIAMTFRLGVDGALQHHQRHAARRGGRKSGGTTVKTVAMDRDVVVTKQALD